MAPSLRQRYLIPIFLLALPAALDSLAWLGEKLASPRAVRSTLTVLVLVVVALDFAPRKGWDEIETRHARLTAGCAAIDAALPRSAVLAAPVGWHLSVYLGRPVFNLAPTMTREKRMDSSEAVFDRHGIDTVVTADFAFGGEVYEKYLVRKYGPGQVVGEARVYRVRH
jgi:hypothetical protein